MSGAADAVIVGAGIVGAACAYTLSREGLRVTVIESGCVANGATGAGMGHIVAMEGSEAEFSLTHFSCGLWNDLAPLLPRELQYERRGTLWVAADEAELAALRGKLEFYRVRGVRAEVVDGAALATAEPNLRPGLPGALFVPDDSAVYAPRVAHWLLDRACERGASVLVGQRVTRLLPDGAIVGDRTKILAGLTICAAGTWTANFCASLPLRPRKGHLVITDRYPGFLHHHVLELGYAKAVHGSEADSVAFNVQPRATGQLLIGSSRQYGKTSLAVEASILRQMLNRVVEFVPTLGRLSAIRVWTGFRPALTDMLPAIGPHPESENVYLAAGHEGLGITTSLGTARLLSDQILGQSSAIDPRPYLPSRFRRVPANG
jgi:D-hydroxyproline dehydrogenase subunit beta